MTLTLDLIVSTATFTWLPNGEEDEDAQEVEDGVPVVLVLIERASHIDCATVVIGNFGLESTAVAAEVVVIQRLPTILLELCAVELWILYEVIVWDETSWCVGPELCEHHSLEAPSHRRDVREPGDIPLGGLLKDSFQADHVATKQVERQVDDGRKRDCRSLVVKDRWKEIAKSGGCLDHHEKN